ncbi:722_t:CDS:2 [Dentiscutata heterogama]|uniref:722_t:CDS:1 n=1 Tax=Dentiscutata heterogama TaxID=1316150 RepID=A0ACA9LQL1_9GLOM|nr:722_t:CDS:2 [Dentiscutata heterogama]
MSGNSEKGKSVTVEDEFAMPSNSDTEPLRGQVNFEANFGQLSLEMLKFLCLGMGISDVGKAVNVDKDTSSFGASFLPCNPGLSFNPEHQSNG